MASSFADGSFVRNTRVPEWGVGKVLERVGPGKVRVFFEHAGERLMLQDALEQVPTQANHPVLSRVDRSRDLKGYVPFPNLESSFLALFKQGFEDPRYLEHERGYKVRASQFLQENLSQDILAPLVDQGEHATVCELAKKAISRTNLIHKFESIALADGLKQAGKPQAHFATALFGLLYGDGDMGARFVAFTAALEEVDACTWTLATYFPFLLDPAAHILVKPKVFQDAARSYAFDFGYTSRPDWKCYQRILEFVRFVAGQLTTRKILSPRDLIDVQSFIWCSLHKGEFKT